jgi:hypothetical protein
MIKLFVSEFLELPDAWAKPELVHQYGLSQFSATLLARPRPNHVHQFRVLLAARHAIRGLA